jgi:hypothetical protein
MVVLVADHPSGSPLPLPELARAITSGAVRLAAATAAWLRLIAEFDERDGWHGYGIASCAHWLAWQCGLSPGAAREHVRVARALRALPLIEESFSAGRLSYSKVRALTRIAEPDTEGPLLELVVELTASQTERTVRQWRRADSLNGDGEPPRRRQSFDHYWDDDGMLTVTVRMPTDQGAGFIAAIQSLAERAARRERAQAKKRSPGERTEPGSSEARTDDARTDDVDLARERTAARRIDALASLADFAADVGRRAGDPPRREVVVHVDAAVLADDAAAGRAYIEGGPALTPAQARRMLCEATVMTALERGHEPLAFGRRRRRATKVQRQALIRRDGGCARPGCPEARIERLHVHHMRHWLFGGRTDIANLVLLCDADHGLVHELDLAMTRRRGRLIVTAPDGRRAWGGADAAFTDGLGGTDAAGTAREEPFIGVHPIDMTAGRRPSVEPGPGRASTPLDRSSRRYAPTTGTGRRAVPRARRTSARRPAAPTGPTPQPASPRRPEGRPNRRPATIGATLFPAGEPELPESLPAGGERMDVRYVVGVLMGNRDLVRRLAAESGVTVAP